VKKTITLIVLAAVIGITGLSFGPTANAVSTVTAARCTVANARLDTRITKVSTATAAHTAAYTKVQTTLDGLITSAKAAGYDTTPMDAASAALQAKITTYTTAAAAYSSDLTATKGLSCGDSDGTFTTSLTTARTDLAAVRTAAVDVRTNVKDTVIPALNGYIAWLKTQSTTSTTSSTTTTGGTN
jgi:hypothetical protein